MDTTKAEPELENNSPTLPDDSRTVAEVSSGPKSAQAPTDIRDHELIRRIGQGSYGEVWLARNVMGTYRAVKIVYRAAFEHVRPFEREFNGIQKFEPLSRSHDGFVDILQIGRTEEYFYYVMELADDVATGQQIDANRYEPKTLRSEVQAKKPLPFEQCIEVGLSLTQALGKLHAHGLIHRDIKPSNIIFVNGIAKLADIGLVAEQSEAKSFVGTEGFIPPEGPGTPQADIYSLGKVLYEIATGKDRHEFPALPTLLGDSETDTHLLELNTVFLKACHSDLNQRYQTCEQMRDDLLLLQSGKSVKRAQAVERRLALLSKASAFGIALTILTSATLWYVHRQAKRESQLRSRAEAGELSARRSLYAADMLLAQQALAKGQLGETQRLLEKHRPAQARDADLRGWEWSLLWKLTRSGELFTLGEHSNVVSELAYSPEGRLLSSGSHDKTARLWDMQERKEIARWRFETSIGTLAFSPDGSLLAVASKWNSVRFFDVFSKSELHAVIPDTNEVSTVTFSKDGRWLGLLGGDELRLFDWSSRKEKGHWHLPEAIRFAFSSDGSKAVTTTVDGTVDAVSLTGAPANIITSPVKLEWPGQPMKHYPLASSADGSVFIASSGLYDAKLLFLNSDSLTPMASIPVHESWVGTVAVSPDGRTIATASADHTAKLWDAQTMELRAVLRGHLDEVWAAAFSPDGTRITTGGKDGTIRVWSTALHNALKTKTVPPADDVLSFPENAIRDVSPDGELFLTQSNQTLTVRSTRRAASMRTLTEPAGAADYAISAQSELLAVASTTGVVHIFNLTNNVSFDLLDATESVRIRFSGDGRTLAGVQGNRIVHIWRLGATVSHSSFPTRNEKSVSAFVLSKRGDKIAFSYEGGEVAIWDLSAGLLLSTLLGHREDANHVVFLEDGRRVVTAGVDGAAKLWDIASGKEILALAGDLNAYFSLALSPDGTRLVAGGGPGTVRIWDVTAEVPRQVVAFQMEKRMVNFVGFSQDGRSLMAGNYDDGHFVIWSAPHLGESQRTGQAIKTHVAQRQVE